MPVRMRLATKGASRKRKISIERSPESVRGVERLLELADVVIEKLKVIGDFFFSPDRWRQNENLAASFAADGIGSLKVEVWLDHNHLDVFLLHLPDEFDGVLRTRRDARAGLDVTDHVEVEMLGEIRPGAVIGDDFTAGVGFHVGEPFLIGLFEPLFEIGVALCEIRGIVGTHLAELVGNALGDAQAVFGIEPIVRIAEGVDVAFGASDHARGNFKNFGETRSVEIARSADLDFGICGLRDQRRQPADFELETDNNEEVGALELEEETGLGVNEVGILIAAGDGFHFDSVAADFLRESGEIGGSGDDLNLAGSASGQRPERCRQKRERREQSAKASAKSTSVHIVLHECRKNAKLERVCAVRAHHEQKLEQELIGVRKLARSAEGEMPKAVLSTNLAELAGPIRKDTGKAGIGEIRIGGAAAAVEAATDGPAAIDAIFGGGVHAESMLSLEN